MRLSACNEGTANLPHPRLAQCHNHDRRETTSATASEGVVKESHGGRSVPQINVTKRKWINVEDSFDFGLCRRRLDSFIRRSGLS
jgi:hypothetical protein